MEVMYRKNKKWKMVRFLSDVKKFEETFKQEVRISFPELEFSTLDIVDVNIDGNIDNRVYYTVFFAIVTTPLIAKSLEDIVNFYYYNRSYPEKPMHSTKWVLYLNKEYLSPFFNKELSEIEALEIRKYLKDIFKKHLQNNSEFV